jgi:hypothetical protein
MQELRIPQVRKVQDHPRHQERQVQPALPIQDLQFLMALALDLDLQVLQDLPQVLLQHIQVHHRVVAVPAVLFLCGRETECIMFKEAVYAITEKLMWLLKVILRNPIGNHAQRLVYGKHPSVALVQVQALRVDQTQQPQQLLRMLRLPWLQQPLLALKVHLVRNQDQPLGQAMDLAPRPHLARNRDQLVQPALVMDLALKLALALNQAQVQSLTLVAPKVLLAHNLVRNQDQVPVMDLDLRPRLALNQDPVQYHTLALKVHPVHNQDPLVALVMDLALRPQVALNQDQAQSLTLALKVRVARNLVQVQPVLVMDLALRPRLARNQALVQSLTQVAPKVHLALN